MLYTSICTYLQYLSIYLLFIVEYIYLCLPPLYLTNSLSIVLCCIHLSVPISSPSSLCNYLSFFLSIGRCCIHLSVPTSSPSSLCNYLSIFIGRCCIHLSICSYSLCNYLSIYCSMLYTFICIYLQYFSIYLLFIVEYIYLYLPPPPPLYVTISLSIYW